jgi:hypothetical protein
MKGGKVETKKRRELRKRAEMIKETDVGAEGKRNK